jgi:hypothetical protein
VSEWSLLNANENIFGYIMVRTSYLRLDDNDIRFVLDQYS